MLGNHHTCEIHKNGQQFDNQNRSSKKLWFSAKSIHFEFVFGGYFMSFTGLVLGGNRDRKPGRLKTGFPHRLSRGFLKMSP